MTNPLQGRLWGLPRLAWAGGALVVVVAGVAAGLLITHSINNPGSTTGDLSASQVGATDPNAAADDQGPQPSEDGTSLFDLGPNDSLESIPVDDPQQVDTLADSGVTAFAPGPEGGSTDVAYAQGNTVYYGGRHRDFGRRIIRLSFYSGRLLVVTANDLERFDDGSVLYRFQNGEFPSRARFDFGGDRLAYYTPSHELLILDIVSMRQTDCGRADQFGSWSLDQQDVFAYVNSGGLFTITANSGGDNWPRTRIADAVPGVSHISWSPNHRIFLGTNTNLVSYDRDGGNRQVTPGDYSKSFTFIPNHPSTLAFVRGNHLSISKDLPPVLVTPKAPSQSGGGQANPGGPNHPAPQGGQNGQSTQSPSNPSTGSNPPENHNPNNGEHRGTPNTSTPTATPTPTNTPRQHGTTPSGQSATNLSTNSSQDKNVRNSSEKSSQDKTGTNSSQQSTPQGSMPVTTAGK